MLKVSEEKLWRLSYFVELRTIEVVDVQRQEDHFEVTLRDGVHEVVRKLVLATGVRDELPLVVL